MAIVNHVPVLEEIRQRNELGVVGLMENQSEITEQEQGTPTVEEEKVYVAVGKEVKDCKSVVLWALKHFRGKKLCLLHVNQPAKMIPMSMGGKFPASKLTEQEVNAYRDVEKQKMHKMLNEYLLFCAQVGVRPEKLHIHKEDIGLGIVELIAQHGIKRLIMGAARDKQYTKKMTTLKSKKAIFVSQQADLSCHIWFVCQGCLIQTREGSLDGTEIRVTETPLESSPPTSSITENPQTDHIRSRSIAEGQIDHSRLANPIQNFIRRVSSQGKKVSTSVSFDGSRGLLMPPRRLPVAQAESVNEWEVNSRGSPSQSSGASVWSSSEEVLESTDSISVVRDEGSEDGSTLSLIQDSEDGIYRSSPMNESNEERVDSEMLDKLKKAMAEAENSKKEAFEELVKRRRAEKDAIEAIRKAKESESIYANEVKQRKEMEALLARDTLELNNMKRHQDEALEELKTAMDQKMVLESQMAESDRLLKELEEKIVSAVELLVNFKQERDRLQLERDNAVQEAEELRKRREEEATSSHTQQFFSEFSFSEIEAATRNFDPCLKIGEGGYGSVFKGFLRNTEVAIKLLNSSSLQGCLEFQQEVDVLSKMRHPNLLTLIGTCPEAWSLVYEYLPNGSLEDRLACKGNTAPLSWQTRIRIAVEICSALIFLHHNKPNGIIHGDLKPGNIILDANFISKLGDFGICRSLPSDGSLNTTTTLCWRTNNPKGTLVYMDPEFLATGELTTKSDVYSFGIVLLQLLTGRPALGITKEVEYALEKGNLSALLDCTAGDWPFVQAKQLAYLALRCCEMNRKSRPDLMTEVWRVLEPMKAACGASSSSRMGSEELSHVPSYFLCPIFQEVMRDPRVAADGFTYECEAISGWLDGGHNTSPMTNLTLSNCDLIPNRSLRSAIEEWLQQR